MTDWDSLFRAKAAELYPATDPSHDLLHILRVVRTALDLADQEGADPMVVRPSAYFHDFVNVPKNDPRRQQASTLSAEAAAGYLQSIGYPAQYLDAIRHAIAAHSFSAGIAPQTIEAQVVQDADRLDALGAVGIARCFSIATALQAPYYCTDDPWAERRELDDRHYTIDHFGVKLYKLPALMNTKAARAEAEKRISFMKSFMDELKMEIS